MLGAAAALTKVLLHSDQLDPGQGIIYESAMLFLEFSAIHTPYSIHPGGGGFRVAWGRYPD